MRIICSGGGTGGHIFPALAIADELKRRDSEHEILFVGAKGRMEMERVPKAGYPIEGLWIAGLQRRLTWKNLGVPVKLIRSLIQARSIIKRFKPDVVVGFGGYASGPVLWVASLMGIPTVIQEQNSYAGLTNKILGKRVDRICVAFEGMERYFPQDKIKLTGNPIRADLQELDSKLDTARRFFEWGQNKKTLLIFGGSLGARSLNEAVSLNIGLVREQTDCLIIWQTGSRHYEMLKEQVPDLPNLRMLPFIERMDLAYCLADLVVCRAGALTLSELGVSGKPAILVPSPNVAEDHQTKNALAVVRTGAALMVPDKEASEVLLPKAFKLMDSNDQLFDMSSAMAGLGKPEATSGIVNEIIKTAHANT